MDERDQERFPMLRMALSTRLSEEDVQFVMSLFVPLIDYYYDKGREEAEK